MKNKKCEIIDGAMQKINPCIKCNPKLYLTFNFAYINHEKPNNPNTKDIVKLWERMRWMSQDTFFNMMCKFGSDKKKWFENIPINQISKNVPFEFRKSFPSEAYEKYSVMRVYPAGSPNESANPRIIGMIKHSIFHVLL